MKRISMNAGVVSKLDVKIIESIHQKRFILLQTFALNFCICRNQIMVFTIRTARAISDKWF